MTFLIKNLHLATCIILLGGMFEHINAGYVPRHQPEIIKYKSLLVFACIMQLISERSLSSNERKEIVAFLKNETEKKKNSSCIFGNNCREISFLSDHDGDALCVIRELLEHPNVKTHPEEINKVLKECFYVQQEIHNIKSKKSYLNFYQELANCLYTAIKEVQKKQAVLEKQKAIFNQSEANIKPQPSTAPA